MENKQLFVAMIIPLCVLLFIGASITGFVVYKVDYDDLCNSDSDCPNNQCCMIYENVGLCMDNCQSINFLCKQDSECEESTVCCISEGMEYGICNQQENCMSLDMYRQYIEKKPIVEKPSPIMIKNSAIIFAGLLILSLLAIILWFICNRDKGRKKR